MAVVLGLGQLEQAEQYLLQAQWTVLKTPHCSNTIRHKLSRYLGLLYAAKQQFSHALRQLAYDVSSHRERKCTDATLAVLVPWAGNFRC